jgi:hypothetical protein
MSCPSCSSSNQAEFSSEIMMHLSGAKNLDKPGVWVFAKISVCLDCGFARWTVPPSELAQLAAGAPTSELLVRKARV